MSNLPWRRKLKRTYGQIKNKKFLSLGYHTNQLVQKRVFFRTLSMYHRYFFKVTTTCL